MAVNPVIIITIDEEAKELIRKFLDAVEMLKNGELISIPSVIGAIDKDIPSTVTTNCPEDDILYWHNVFLQEI